MSKSETVKFEIIYSWETTRWNETVRQFSHWDIYYLNEYACSLKVHGDGEPYLIHFAYENIGEGCENTSEKCELCYAVMKKDISTDAKFSGLLSHNRWYDLETPYGYGGFLITGEFSESARLAFEREATNFANKNRIVSQFVRFYPVYRNEIPYSHLLHSEIRYLKDTIYIDTTDEEGIMQQMHCKNRTAVRKAAKSGVTVFHDKGEHLDEFISIYESAMDHNKASSYYYFERPYYQYLKEHMRENIEFFYSVYEDKIIGASIFFYNQEFMHYHLSGMCEEYRSIPATNLLLYEAALWANRKGIRLLHLGGGIEAEDSLFHFKKVFNRNGRLPFYVGRTIYNELAYQELLSIRKKADSDFNEHNEFMIQYRK